MGEMIPRLYFKIIHNKKSRWGYRENKIHHDFIIFEVE